MTFDKKIIDSFLEHNSHNNNCLYQYILEIEEISFSSIINERSKSKDTFFFWSAPSQKFSFLALLEYPLAQSKAIFNLITNNKSNVNNNVVICNSNTHEFEIPIFCGGLKFSSDSKENLWEDFCDELWFIPKVMLVKHHSSYYCILNFLGSKFDDSLLNFAETLLWKETNSVHRSNSIEKISAPNKEAEWNNSVSLALQNIGKGSIEKVVLARKLVAKINLSFSISSSLKELEEKFQDCTMFCLKKNSSFFFGASPEKLFTLSNNVLETDALAGSISRGINSEEDISLENDLLNSTKENLEHNSVVQYVISKLNSLSNNVNFDSTPRIKKLNNIQHLWTKIKADIKNEISFIDIIRLLHPTPAVCGFPKYESFNLIKELENFDRGLYSGTLGWFTEKQNGAMIVAIRSALLKDSLLHVFAGCGIVNGSDPKLEFEETQLKMNSILSLFENENKN